MLDTEKTSQIQLKLLESRKELFTTFSKKVLHKSSLGGWLKDLANDAINNATPEQKAELERLLGV